MDIPDDQWEIEQEDGQRVWVAGPHEYRHTLSTVFNGLIGRGFQLLGLWEAPLGDPAAANGTWQHFNAVAPPWITTWWRA